MLLPELQARWDGRLYVTRSLPHFIEISDPQATKSAALAYLCERLPAARERTVACGDGWNDVDMMRWAGLGVAVAEASDRRAGGRRSRRAARRAGRALRRLADALRRGRAEASLRRPRASLGKAKAAPGG